MCHACFNHMMPDIIQGRNSIIHSMTIKFPNWRYYSNTTNAIRNERQWLERAFIYMVCKFQLVWLMHMRITRYNCFGQLSFFVVSNVSKWSKEQRLSFVWNKTAMKRLKCWEVRMVKNVYREQGCLNGIKGSKMGESRYKTMNEKAVLQLPEQ
jgi:hypothetical protein